MLFKRLFLTFCFSFISSASFALTLPSFTSGEHIAIGDEVKIRFSANDPGQAGFFLHLSNGLNLTYGTILALGDFYGAPDKAISDGNTPEERQARFLTAFNSFTTNNDVIPELRQIVTLMQAEEEFVENGLKNGEKEEDIYKKLGDDLDRQYNCATGGGCTTTAWWTVPGRYLLLVEHNYDHFGQDAMTTYQTGHAIAMNLAIAAHQNKDIKKLELAYAINAFACHFLSDRFASGHMRTPRRELPTAITPSLIGDLLINYMHNEENFYGLHVHNLLGEHWTAVGDKSYYSENGALHRQHVLAAMQVSIDQVFLAYLTGAAPDHDSILDLLPLPDEADNAANVDISPLFYQDKQTQKLMRRKDLVNMYDKHWTSDWWGWSTLLALKESRGLPMLSQAMLARSELKDQAVEAGLITDPGVLAYLKGA